MAEQKMIMAEPPPRPELDRLIAKARETRVSDEELREQRVSFAYGNAPESDLITKESVRTSSETLRMAFA